MIRETAANAVREALKSFRSKLGPRLFAQDKMDDGTPIVLTIDLNESGTAVFDFTGTGPEVLANHNAPFSITHSAIMYCMRSMLNTELPLNQGCLLPLTITIPSPSLLSPSNTAAVVAGNVLTSQRIVDVILKAFQVCAASQGDCNNLTFGVSTKILDTGEKKQGWGYYETIAGGAGAGPTWHGRSGVHTHMTNTRITDPEILERRYPVILNAFTLRPNSGGQGQFKGGDGVERSITFLETLNVSILSERRVIAPYGMKGGQDGHCGLNLLYVMDQNKTNTTVSSFTQKQKEEQERKQEQGPPNLTFSNFTDLHLKRKINVGGRANFQVNRGDTLTLFTPGGGGYGLVIDSLN